jgi:hypothetical protein
VCLFVCLVEGPWFGRVMAQGGAPLPLHFLSTKKALSWDIVHVCRFTIFRSTEQKLLNLEWFLFLEIKWKFQMIFSQLGCIRTLEVKPTFYVNSMGMGDQIKVDLALASIVFLCIDNWCRGIIKPLDPKPNGWISAYPQWRQNKSSMRINFCCRKSQSESGVQIMPFLTTLYEIIFQWWSYPYI